MFVYLVVVAVILCILHIAFNYNAKARHLKKVPGLHGKFILGNALDIILSPVELYKFGRMVANRFNGIYGFWAYPIGAINIYNPEDVEIIMSNIKYSDKSFLYTFLRPWLRDGLLLSKGSKWMQRRKILTPAFHFNILRQFCIVMEENSQRMVHTLSNREGRATDIVPLLSECTLNSICETAMGTKFSEEISDAGKTYKSAIHKLGKVLVTRFATIIYHAEFIFNLSPSGRSQRKYLGIIHNFTEKVIKDRKEYLDTHGIKVTEQTLDDDTFMSKKKKTAMLDLLISAQKDGLIDHTGIQEEVDTFMFEGHDTTASGLMYCLVLLANHKDIQDKVIEELDEIFGDSDRLADIDALSKMRYLERCIKESLRLYPPVHFISRSLNEPVTLSNYYIPAGVYCNIHIFDLHRREDIYKDPLKFDPDRFLPENCAARHPFAYIPFSAGPRNCIGQKFAMMEMKSVVSAILREFELHPVTKIEDLETAVDLVLRNAAPVYVSFVKRNKNTFS